jgi:hypothetical protein
MLTVAAIRDRVVTELQAAVGFELKRKRPSLRLIKRINPETEVFFHPGVSKKRAELRLDPVIGIENFVLRERLLSTGWKGSTSACHAYLGMVDSWGHLVVRTEADLDTVARRIVKSVEEVGLPIMMNFDSSNKVAALCEETLAHHVNKWHVAVIFAKEKLALLRTN